MINKIINGIKRLFFGSTFSFQIRKGSCSLSGASWTEIYKEMTKTPLKMISATFITENDINVEYRIVVDGEKIFPFGYSSKIENGVTRGFIVPIEVAAGSYMQIEVMGQINAKNVIIMDELAVVEIL